jgi:predicted RNA-binding protein YlqC (UPF0109 family)
MNSTEAFLRYVLSILLRHPQKMKLEKKETPQEISFHLTLAHDDAGRLIGRHGRTISAIRGLMQVTAARVNKHASLTLEDEEKLSDNKDNSPSIEGTSSGSEPRDSHAG